MYMIRAWFCLTLKALLYHSMLVAAWDDTLSLVCAMATRIIPSFELCVSKLGSTRVLLCSDQHHPMLIWMKPALIQEECSKFFCRCSTETLLCFCPTVELWLQWMWHWCLWVFWNHKEECVQCVVSHAPCSVSTLFFFYFRLCCKIAKGNSCVEVFSSIHPGSWRQHTALRQRMGSK